MSGEISPPILVIGSGNMGIPVIASLLKNGADASQMTIIAGTQKGPTSPEVTVEALRKEGIAQETIDAIIILARDDKKIKDIADPKTVLYASKPQFLDDIKSTHYEKTQHASTLISIAAGAELNCNALSQLCPNADVMRTMPNLARRVYGIYADDKVEAKKKNAVIKLFGGLGEAFPLPNEGKAFTDFTVHSGCAPAFVAAMIGLLTEDETQNKNEVTNNYFVLTEYLQNLAKNPSLNYTRSAPPKMLDFLKEKSLAVDEEAVHSDQMKSAAFHFYERWVKVAEKDFGITQGSKIVKQTILGTLEALQKSNENPIDYANRVRSGKGLTNMGLLCMGIAVPDEKKFGTKQENARQNFFAQYFKQKFSVEESIIPALMAAKGRARGMVNAKNPIYMLKEGGEKVLTLKEVVHESIKILTPSPAISYEK